MPDYTAAGAWIVASPLAHSITAEVALIENSQPYCGGTMLFGINLSRYSNGALAGTLTAAMGDTGNATGWRNTVSNGEIYDSSLSVMASNAGSATSVDFGTAQLPVGPSSSGHPGGRYAAIGNFTYSNTDCIIVLEEGLPGYTDIDGHTAYFPDLYDIFDFAGTQGDPTPWIDSITLSQPLVAGGSAIATIDGGNFGPLTGILGICDPGDDPCPSGASKVSATVTAALCTEVEPSLPSCMTAHLGTPKILR